MLVHRFKQFFFILHVLCVPFTNHALSARFHDFGSFESLLSAVFNGFYVGNFRSRGSKPFQKGESGKLSFPKCKHQLQF